MSHVTRRGPVKPTLNITPLIDVVFLLIVFFLLVNNIVTDEVPELKLPELDRPQTSEPQGDSRVIINIVPIQRFEGEPGPGTPVGEVLARGGDAEFVSVGKQKWRIADQGALEEFRDYVAATIAQRLENNPNRPPLVMLRADAAIYYEQVLPILGALQLGMVDGGLDPKIAEQAAVNLVAYMPQD